MSGAGMTPTERPDDTLGNVTEAQRQAARAMVLAVALGDPDAADAAFRAFFASPTPLAGSVGVSDKEAGNE